MVCNCIVDKPTYPQNEEWGPFLWWILHALAGKAGRQIDPILRADEGRAWPLLVKELVQILPCPYCRDHLQEYLKENPFELPLDWKEWKLYVTDYFYELHEVVNRRIGKASFSKELLDATYKDVTRFRENFGVLQKIVEKAIKMGGVSLFAWRAWVKQVNFLVATIF